jgi:hypothetical protein
MKFISCITSFVALFSVASALGIIYDNDFDNANIPLAGPTSLQSCASSSLAERYTTYGSLPSFPNISAARALLLGPSGTECGSCWAIQYEHESVVVTVVHEVAQGVEVTNVGFFLPLKPMNALTNGHGKDLGVIDAQVVQVDQSHCGLTLLDSLPA